MLRLFVGGLPRQSLSSWPRSHRLLPPRGLLISASRRSSGDAAGHSNNNDPDRPPPTKNSSARKNLTLAERISAYRLERTKQGETLPTRKDQARKRTKNRPRHSTNIIQGDAHGRHRRYDFPAKHELDGNVGKTGGATPKLSLDEVRPKVASKLKHTGSHPDRVGGPGPSLEEKKAVKAALNTSDKLLQQNEGQKNLWLKQSQNTSPGGLGRAPTGDQTTGDQGEKNSEAWQRKLVPGYRSRRHPWDEEAGRPDTKTSKAGLLPWETQKADLGVPWEASIPPPTRKVRDQPTVLHVKEEETDQDKDFLRGKLERMIGGGSYGGKDEDEAESEQDQATKKPHKTRRGPVGREVQVPPVALTVTELAGVMSLKVDRVLWALHNLGESVTTSSLIEPDTAELVALEMGMRVERLKAEEQNVQRAVPSEDMYEDLPPRPPVVGVMGHVDHGKTTLLDALRSTNSLDKVAGTEAAGITQKIGAFTVPVQGSSVTFFDTPGHMAFKAMRISTSKLTDIVVVVVAGDDGLKPQTIEVLDMLKELPNLAAVVAVTKIDRPEVDATAAVDRISKELLANGITVEEYGGEISILPVSGVTRQGIDDLLQALLLQAEMMELRADDQAPGEGLVVDSSLEKGLGGVTDVLVSWGKLKVGDIVVAGTELGKIKIMKDSAGKNVRHCGPGQPVRLTGFKGLPKMGDQVLVVPSLDKAHQVIALRERDIENTKLEEQAFAHKAQKEVEDIRAQVKKDAEEAFRERRVAISKAKEAMSKSLSKEEGAAAAAELMAQAVAREQEQGKRAIGAATGEQASGLEVGPTPCNMIFKAEGFGALLAMEEVMEEVPQDQVALNVLRAEVGPVTRSDIDLAVTADNAPIFAFNVKLAGSDVKAYAQNQGVQIHSHNVIYRFMEDARQVMSALLPIKLEETLVGSAEVLQLFNAASKGNEVNIVAGCSVIEGKLNRAHSFRVLRGDAVVWEGDKSRSMRRFKDKVNEVTKGKECGVSLVDFNDFEIGDVLQCYSVKEVQGQL